MRWIGFVAAGLLSLTACTPTQEQASAREWQRAECNKIIDKEDRERCMRRLD